MRRYLDSIHHLAQVRLSLYSSPNRTAPLIYLHCEIKILCIVCCCIIWISLWRIVSLSSCGVGRPIIPIPQPHNLGVSIHLGVQAFNRLSAVSWLTVFTRSSSIRSQRWRNILRPIFRRSQLLLLPYPRALMLRWPSRPFLRRPGRPQQV